MWWRPYLLTFVSKYGLHHVYPLVNIIFDTYLLICKDEQIHFFMQCYGFILVESSYFFFLGFLLKLLHNCEDLFQSYIFALLSVCLCLSVCLTVSQSVIHSFIHSFIYSGASLSWQVCLSIYLSLRLSLSRFVQIAFVAKCFGCLFSWQACQSCEMDILIPLQLGSSKLVLVGDPEQLPPTVLSRVSEVGLYCPLQDFFSEV